MSATLPSVVARQFVLNSDVDEVFLRMNRRIVWYRERFLENLSCSWRCGSRSGIVDFTDYTLNLQALQALKSPDFDVLFELESGERKERNPESDFLLSAHEFLNVQATIINHSQNGARLVIEHSVDLRHAEDDLDMSGLYVSDGPSNRRTVLSIGENASTQVHMSFVFLARGIYDLVLHVYDETYPSRSSVQRQGLWVE